MTTSQFEKDEFIELRSMISNVATVRSWGLQVRSNLYNLYQKLNKEIIILLRF